MKSHLNRLLLSTLVLVLFLSLFGLETVRVQGQVIEAPTEDQRLINYFEPVDLSMDTFEEEVFLTQYNVDIHPSSLDSVAAASREVHKFQRQLRGYYTNYELLTKLSRWVAGRFKYDEDYWLTGMSDALVASKGVCWYYAYLFDYLAKSYGFTSQVMYGYIDGKAHKKLPKEAPTLQGVERNSAFFIQQRIRHRNFIKEEDFHIIHCGKVSLWKLKI